MILIFFFGVCLCPSIILSLLTEYVECQKMNYNNNQIETNFHSSKFRSKIKFSWMSLILDLLATASKQISYTHRTEQWTIHVFFLFLPYCLNKIFYFICWFDCFPLNSIFWYAFWFLIQCFLPFLPCFSSF